MTCHSSTIGLISLLICSILVSLSHSTPHLKISNSRNLLRRDFDAGAHYNVELLLSDDADSIQRVKDQWLQEMKMEPSSILEISSHKSTESFPEQFHSLSEKDERSLTDLASKLQRLPLISNSLQEMPKNSPLLVILKWKRIKDQQHAQAIQKWILSQLKENLTPLQNNKNLQIRFDVLLQEDNLQQVLETQEPGIQLTNVSPAKRSLLSTKAVAASSDTEDLPEDWERADYQMLIWTSIIVVILLIVGYSVMNGIDYSKDANLYAAGQF